VALKIIKFVLKRQFISSRTPRKV